MLMVDLFNILKNTSSKNEKIELLKNFKSEDENEDLQRFLFNIYNPFIKFGITSNVFSNLKGTGKQRNIVPNTLSVMTTDLLMDKSVKFAHIQNMAQWLEPVAFQWFSNAVDKDLGIGMDVKSINKAFPNLLPEFDIPLAEPQTEKTFNDYFGNITWAYVNLKIDGIRCLIFIHDENRIDYISRNGLPIKPFLTELIDQDIRKVAALYKGLILDGEIFSDKFQNLQRIITRKKATTDTLLIRNSTRFAMFDCVKIEEFKSGECEKIPLTQRLGLVERFAELSRVIKVKYLKIATNYELIYKLSRKWIQEGREGLILKHPSSGYFLKRCSYWMKFKNKSTEDLKVVNYFEGKSKYVGMLGGFVLDLGNGKTVNCGGGYTDAERKEFWQHRDEYVGRTMEVSFMETTGDASLRHPVFECFRFDK